MDRNYISTTLKEIREATYCGKAALCRISGLSMSQLLRIEEGTRDIKMTAVLQYLDGLNYCVELSYKKNKDVIVVYSLIPDFMRSVIHNENIEVSQLAEQIGCRVETCIKKLNNVSEMREDLFCQLCDVLQINVRFIRKGAVG